MQRRQAQLMVDHLRLRALHLSQQNASSDSKQSHRHRPGLAEGSKGIDEIDGVARQVLGFEGL
jgi:hypothetical protein